MTITRCDWATDDPLYIAYHDEEWGVPIHDERHLFELLILEGAQAGLSWITILRKRENYRAAYDSFDVHKIAAYDEAKVQELLGNVGIVRNKLKVRASIQNAQAFIRVQQEFGSFDTYLWQFVGGKPAQNARRSMADIPAQTETSQTMSKDLRKRGFNFVGPTICYAYMQSAGLVNDHVTDCFRYHPIAGLSQND